MASLKLAVAVAACFAVLFLLNVAVGQPTAEECDSCRKSCTETCTGVAARSGDCPDACGGGNEATSECQACRAGKDADCKKSCDGGKCDTGMKCPAGPAPAPAPAGADDAGSP